MQETFRVIKVNKELSAGYRNKLISENSKRFVLLFMIVALSQTILVLLELLRILKWDNSTFIARIAVFCLCSVFAGLIFVLDKHQTSKKTRLIQGIIILSIQFLSIAAGCYFVVHMFNAGIYSYSAFLLVAFIVSITSVRTPYFYGSFVLLFFVGLTIYLSTYNTHLSNWVGELIIALVFVFLLYIGSVLTYNRNIKLYLLDKEMQKLNANLETMSQTDELTGINNRRKISQVIDEHLDLARRYETCFCVVIIDIDLFKKVNDHYGHNAGDLVLCQFASSIQSMLRTTDIFGRWGGEEFLILVPNCQDQDAFLLIERLRKSVEKINFFEAGNVTFSAGICSYQSGDTFSKLTEGADIALYKAKMAGRNQTVIYNQD